jgi:anti-sigma factor RsiW
MDQHPVSDTDLQAYIDGQLDATRRIEVQAYLATRPEDAAEIMEGLRLRDEFRFFLAEESWPAATETIVLVERLGRALRLRALVPRFQAGVAAACLIGLGVSLGWMGHAEFTDPVADNLEVAADPAEVLADDAAQAWHISQLDQEPAVSAPAPGPPQTVAPDATASSPALPQSSGLRRVGSDLIPWNGGTAAADLLVMPKGNELVLLTAETPTQGFEAPEAEQADGVTTVSWRLGRYAYALSGNVPASDLLRLAHTVAPGS